MRLNFVKMQGLGNDYVYIDCISSQSLFRQTLDLPRLARVISDRHLGVGSDGLVLMLPSKEADARMRIFNADGSEAQMCGNAIRCVGKYLYESGLCHRNQLAVETLAGLRFLTMEVIDSVVKQVKVNMGIPQVTTGSLALGERDILGYTSVNMGNPHAVFFRNWVISDAEMSELGKHISTHPHFPEGTNVEFVYVRNVHELDVRVWERGTGETLACGTGACAAAVAAIQHGLTERNVTVHMRGGDLIIHWNDNGTVLMTGPAAEVFRGTYNWEE